MSNLSDLRNPTDILNINPIDVASEDNYWLDPFSLLNPTS